MWKGRQWNQNTLSRDKRRNETKTFIYSPLLLIWQFYFEQKSWDIASLWCLIIQQNSTKLSELFPGQWQFLILDNDVLWSSTHRRPLKQSPSVPTISGHKWHQQEDIRCVLTSSCPRTLTQNDIWGPPQICSLLFSFLPRQWPPASAQTGPSVKSDPISKPFVKTFYVQQFLFVFVVRHSSSVPLRSHVPWLGHLGQKSQALSVSVTPGQIFIETRSQKCAILWPLGSLSEN